MVSPWPTTSSSLARKQMKSQVVVTAAIPCLALGGLNTGAGILRGCYHKEQWLRAELRPVLRVKCCGPRQKLDGSASCCSSFIRRWRLRTRCQLAGTMLLKGIVHPKFHPFNTHPYINEGSDDGQKEFHPIDAYGCHGFKRYKK